MIWRCAVNVLFLALISIFASIGCTGNLVFGDDGLGQDAQSLTGVGTASISPSAAVTVGSVGTWTIEFEAGAGGIAQEGGIRVTIPGLWSPPQISQPDGMGYVTATSAFADLELEVENNEPEDAVVDAMHDHVTITLVYGSLSEGETVVLTYGDPSGGGEGAMAPASPRTSMTFTVATDAAGTGTYSEIPSSPSLAVVPGEPAKIRIVARQSIVYLGEPLDLSISLRDQFDNLANGYTGDIRIEDSADSTAVALGNSVVDVEVLSTESSIRYQVYPTAAGNLWFEAEDTTATLDLPTAKSNPVWVLPASETEGRSDPRPSDLRCYWGDIHAHSDCSNDAQSSVDPATMYVIMSGGADLDFGAVTDHEACLYLDYPYEDCDWNESDSELGPKAAANEYYDEGTFVTFLGYEWTNTPYGHKHVLFYQDNGTENSDYILGSTGEGIPLLQHNHSDSNTPCKLWKEYDNQTINAFNFFTIPHHPANYDNTPPRVDWNEYPSGCNGLGASDWVYQPLVEVYSRHGNNEKIENHATDGMVFTEDDPIHCRVEDDDVVRAALTQQDSGEYRHRMGIIGGGDSHDGRPGLYPSGNDNIIEDCVSTPYLYPSSTWGNEWYQYPRPGLVCTCLEDSSFAAGLTRKKVFEALQGRYAYGTTGERIIAWLNIEKTGSSSDNYSMGEEGSGVLSTDVFEAQVYVVKDGEDLDEVRLMWFDPDEGDWDVCKSWTSGSGWPGSLSETVDLYTEGCTNDEEVIYYLVAEQDYIRETQFRVSNINKYIKFIFYDNGDQKGDDYGAMLQTSWYASGSTLAAEIEDKMETAIGGGDTIDASYSAVNHKFTIEVADPVNDELLLRWGTPITHNNAALLLGFNRSDTVELTSHESDWAIESDGHSPRDMVWTSPIWMTYTQ